MAARKKMGEILVDANLIDQETLEQALVLQRGTGKRLGQTLEEMDVILEEDIAVALGRQFGFRSVKGLAMRKIDPGVLQLIPAEEALKHYIFPLQVEKKKLYLAMANPLDLSLTQEISFRHNLEVIPCVTTPDEIKSAVNHHLLHQEEGEAGDRGWVILVIETQEASLRTIETVLKGGGFRVFQATNAAEGLAVALRERPHLILCDTFLPDLNQGPQMFGSIKAERGIDSTPAIAMSIKGDPREEARLLEAGYVDFITKPINSIRILSRVRLVLRTCYGRKLPSL